MQQKSSRLAFIHEGLPNNSRGLLVSRECAAPVFENVAAQEFASYDTYSRPRPDVPAMLSVRACSVSMAAWQTSLNQSMP
jgi:hypothetical protein